MTINPLSSVSQLFLSGIHHKPGLANTGDVGSTTTDTSQLSPFAQLMNTLQQLQQADPTKFQQVAGKLATDLTSAANTAQSNGNTAEAGALNQLAASFNQASQNGQLPSFIQQGAANTGAAAPPHHHHHHGGAQAFSQDLNSISQSILSNLDPTNTGAGANTGSNNTQQ